MKLINKILKEFSNLVYFLLSNVPGFSGIFLRKIFLTRKFQKCGDNLMLSSCVEISGFENIQFGNNVQVSMRCSIHAHNHGKLLIGNNFGMNVNSTLGASDNGEIIIGDNVMIAQNVVIRASNHKFENIDIPISMQGHSGGRIVIGNGCWISANVVITSNVNIGEHSIIGAGAVVTHDVQPYSVVGGVPAKLIRFRK
jgi:galactoside O-acetyltransferase